MAGTAPDGLDAGPDELDSGRKPSAIGRPAVRDSSRPSSGAGRRADPIATLGLWGVVPDDALVDAVVEAHTDLERRLAALRARLSESDEPAARFRPADVDHRAGGPE